VKAPIVDGSQVRVERLLRPDRMSGFRKIDGPLRVDTAPSRFLKAAVGCNFAHIAGRYPPMTTVTEF
jgi:hypothetical protein